MQALKLALAVVVLVTLLICGVIIPATILNTRINNLRENNRNQIELKEYYKKKFEDCKNQLGVFYKEDKDNG